MNLRSNLNRRVTPPKTRKKSTSDSRSSLLAALEAQEKLNKAGESSYRAANANGLHFDQRTGRRAEAHYDSQAASRAGVSIYDPEGCFHILSFTPFTQRGTYYPTVHHFVMSERFKGSPIESEIPAAASLWEIDRLCEMGEANGWERPDWPQVRLNTLIIGSFLKFRQNPEALKILIRTKQKTIVQENLPPHYQKWIAYEKVEKVKKDGANDFDDDNGRSARSRRSASEHLSQQAAERAGISTDEKTVITGSSHKNLGGAVLMSIRKKLFYAYQADDKARIKRRQMEILAQQLAEQKKKEEEKAAKQAAKEAAEAEKAARAGSKKSSPKSSRPSTRGV